MITSLDGLDAVNAFPSCGQQVTLAYWTISRTKDSQHSRGFLRNYIVLKKDGY